MAHRIIRIGIYWFPPIELIEVMLATWIGKLNQYEPCRLVAKFRGDCLVWGVHATLLDAISILESDRKAFIQEMSEVLKNFGTINLGKPVLFCWKPNVFIRWEDRSEMKRMEDLRKTLSKKAEKYLVLNQVSWEDISEIKHTISVSGKKAKKKFIDKLNRLEERMRTSPPWLIVAPNIPLSWYIDRRLGDGHDIVDGELPFPLSPHISVATAVRGDVVVVNGESKKKDAKGVGRYILHNLRGVPEWSKALEEPGNHKVECAYIVGPASPQDKEPIDVVVGDRIFRGTRAEQRQPWVKGERLPLS